jgi:hypothetical protein
MAHDRSTAQLRDGATEGESRDSVRSVERTESVDVSDSSHRGDSDEGSCTRSYLFGPSMVTVSRIQEIIDSDYFAEGGARVPGEDTVLKLKNDEVVMFEQFFAAGLRMPSLPVPSDILLKFQVQLHQLTPNVIGQLSKYVWVVASFGGVPSTDGFAKRYKLHYQPKRMSVDGADVLAQYGCVNFQAKHYGGQGARLTVVVKNKCFGGWTQARFYCKVPLLQTPDPLRGKSVYALHSSLTALDVSTDPLFQCADDDSGDVAFVQAMGLIGGRDTVKEYLACGLFPLSAWFSFGKIIDGEMPVSKVALPLPEFLLAKLQGETNDHFQERVDLDAENDVGGYIRAEHDACILSLPNGGQFNWVF